MENSMKSNKQVENYKAFKSHITQQFNHMGCEAIKKLEEHFGFIPSFQELKFISTLLSMNSNIPYTREFSREKYLTIYWINKNIESFETLIKEIKFVCK